MERELQNDNVISYLKHLDDFLNVLYRTESNDCNKKWLMDKMADLAQESLAIGQYDMAQRLYNLAGGYRQVEIFMPTGPCVGTENCEKNMDRFSDKSNDRLIIMITHELSRTGAPVVFFDGAKKLLENGYYVIMLSPMDGDLRQEICEAGIPVIIDHSLLYGRCEQEEFRKTHMHQKWIADSFVSCGDLIIINTAVLHNATERYMYKNPDKKILWWLHEGNVSFESFGDCMPKELTDQVHVSFVSDYVREQAEKSGICYTGDVLHYGVEDFHVSRSKRELTIDTSVTKFVIVGAVSERKGQDLLLQAINRLPMDYLKKSLFYFVGSPADAGLYQRIKMLSNGSDFIQLCPSMPREKLLDFYEECDYIVCASRDDPLPVVLTEMMILSRPCICSRHTGTAAYIEDGVEGYLFENEDIDALTAKLCMVIDNPKNKEAMGKAARKLYEKQFTMDVFEKKLLKKINQLLEDK